MIKNLEKASVSTDIQRDHGGYIRPIRYYTIYIQVYYLKNKQKCASFLHRLTINIWCGHGAP